MLFFCGIVFGNGRVRLYMALCLLLGATAYFLLLSPWTRRALDILARAAARFLGWVTAPLRWLIRVLTAPLAKILRKWKKTWKKFFSFSRLWSTICHLIGKHGKSVAPERQETEAAPHVPIQKGWSSCEDHSADPVGLSSPWSASGKKLPTPTPPSRPSPNRSAIRPRPTQSSPTPSKTAMIPPMWRTSPGKNWVWWHPMTVCSILPIKGPALYLLIA